MMNLKDILYRVEIREVLGNTDREIQSLCFDSREASAGSAFIAIRGSASDGHQFIEPAIHLGAVAIVCEELPASIHEHVVYIITGNSSEALGYMAANYFGNPSDNIQVVGITGTNGKTTTVTLLHKLMRSLGKRAGLLSTVVNRINDREIPSTHTTPDAISLQKLLREMVDEGCEYCFMEASSHAIHQHRTTGIRFKIALFTNITHDHLDYHKTFAEYIRAKKALFDQLSRESIAIVNHDDVNGSVMVQNCKARVKTFALRSMADYKAKVLENNLGGLHLIADGMDMYSKLVGSFNAYNILAVYAVCRELGFERLEVLTALSSLEPVEGRFQHFRSQGGITVIIDYAHTPDALENVLKTIKDIRTGNEKLITVIGCGGDRDKGKRPEMSSIAARFSDHIVLTSDNPRSESPEQIIREMEQGLDPIGKRKTLSLSDRKEAIRLAITLAQPDDIVLIAGKGHEKYQEIMGVKHPFDDMTIARETFKNNGK
jgi:UDP-N-acetylmuramoyl-L-alanyl-D-glutamate--2,6-diaminopimelate ligase